MVYLLRKTEMAAWIIRCRKKGKKTMRLKINWKKWMTAGLCLMLLGGCAPRQAEKPAAVPTAVPSAVLKEERTPEPSPAAEPVKTRWIDIETGSDAASVIRTFYLDLDGDGQEETLSAAYNRQENGMEGFTVTVEDNGAETLFYETDYRMLERIGLADLDPEDGKRELLMVYDMMSDDYVTECFEVTESGISGPIELGGFVQEAENGILTVEDYVDMLGTYGAYTTYRLVGGEFVQEDALWHVKEDWWDEWHTLTVERELPVVLSDGTESTLPVGTCLVITATDRVSEAYFSTTDGVEGKILVDLPDGWPRYISGVPEDAYFGMLPYAG